MVNYLTLLIRTLELSAEFEQNFDDMEPGSYYYDAIGTAKELGITLGVGNNKFNPKENITRQDMMVLTVRAMEKLGLLTVSKDTAMLNNFSDRGDIADYAKESMVTLVKEGMIVGAYNKLNPSSPANRAETAVLIYRIYKFVTQGLGL